MQYIIFGAGASGADAIGFLGRNRVKCFADNDVAKEEFCGKPVISFEEMLKESADTVIVIASEKYYANMETQLKAHGVKRYFVFHESHRQTLQDTLPSYWLYGQREKVSYTRALLHKQIDKYQSIAIYGTNAMLPYLIAEIAILNGFESIKQIITDEEYDRAKYLGIPCVKLPEMRDDIDCVILNKRRHAVRNAALFEVCQDLVDLYDIDEIEPEFYYPELEKYKDMYKGKRIFVIGNGPSLTMADLDKLAEHREVCIGFNMVYRAFGRTKWKPDYLVMGDPRQLSMFVKDVHMVDMPVIMADRYKQNFLTLPYMSEVEYVHYKGHEYYPNMPGFSEDITKGVFGYAGVAYMGLQLAAYMGASEIYLLGVDNNSVGNPMDKTNHFIEGYFTEAEFDKYKDTFGVDPQNKSNITFKAAERYSRQHGFCIYNATRGGKLEVFERVNFDSLF